jgi:hypothetical protein
MAQHPLFSRNSIFDVVEHQQRELREAFKKVPQSALADADLPETLAQRFELNVPVLADADKKHTTKEVEVDVSQDPRRFIHDRSRAFYVPGTEITIHIPFKGDAALFDVHPTTYNLNPPIGDFNERELQFVYTIIEPTDITPELDRTIGQVKQHLEWLRPSAEQLKSQLLQLANSLIHERQQRTASVGKMVANLGIPPKEEVAVQPAVPQPSAAQRSAAQGKQERWDFFISHASEDKDAIARPLADALTAKRYSVWYDDFTLSLGDSLRQSIDHGLAHSRYGIVILSPHFFEKHWPQQELNGLATREVNGEKVILPVWHGVGFDEVRQYSVTLADRLAVSTAQGLEYVVQQILKAAK